MSKAREARDARLTQIMVEHPDIAAIVYTSDEGQHYALKALYGFKQTRAYKFIKKRLNHLNDIIDKNGPDVSDEMLDLETYSEVSSAAVKCNFRGMGFGLTRQEAKNLIASIINQL